jgi:hypothetical protein
MSVINVMGGGRADNVTGAAGWYHAAGRPWALLCFGVFAALLAAAPLAAQGFNRTAAWFGQEDFPTSDLVVFDIDANDEMDAIAASTSDDGDHMIYWSILEEEPPSPTALASSRGGRALIAVAEFDGNEGLDVVIVDSQGIRLYLNVEGELTYETEYTLGGLGEPLHILAGDFVVAGSGVDLIIAYAEGVVCLPDITDDFNAFHFTIGSFGLGVSSIMAKSIANNPKPEILILAQQNLYAYEVYAGSATLYDDWSFEGAVYVGAGCLGNCYVAVATDTMFQLYEYDEGWDLVNETPFPYARPVRQIIAADITGGASCDFVIRAAGMTYIVRQQGTYPDSELVFHEFVGYPDGANDIMVKFQDVNDDAAADLVVGRTYGPHGVFVNGDRLEVTIHDGDDAYQVVDGEAYAVFVVELDAEPASMVVVVCETVSEEDVDSFTQSLTEPRAVTPISRSLVFGPGETKRRFLVPLTPHFEGVNTLLTVQVVAGSTLGAIVDTGGTATVTIHPMDEPAFDWRLGSKVNAIVSTGGNIYFGGDFQGMNWPALNRMGNIDRLGIRRLPQATMPNAPSQPVIHCMETDSEDCLYIGGEFEFTLQVPGTQDYITFRNIARMDVSGNWDLSFRPNPNGPVHAIAVFEQLGVPTWVYFGGKFDSAANSTGGMTSTGHVRNVYRWPVSGTVGQPLDMRIRISSDTDHDATIPLPENDDAVVWAMDIHGPILAIGGEKMFSVRLGIRGNFAGVKNRSIANLALIGIAPVSLSGTVNAPSFPDEFWPGAGGTPGIAPRALMAHPGGDTSSNTAVVRSVRFAHDLHFNDLFSDSGPGALALAFAGEFNYVRYRKGHTNDVTLLSRHVGLTTFEGHVPSVEPGDLPEDYTPVWSVAFDDQDNLWVARDVGSSPSSTEAIWVYDIDTSSHGAWPSKDALFVHLDQFDVGPNGPVYALRFWRDPNTQRNDHEMIAVGKFTSRPGTRTYNYNPYWGDAIPLTIPAENITVYSTTTAPDGVTAYDFGAHRPNFRAAASASGGLRVIATYRGNPELGYVFSGDTLASIRAERTNLAAMRSGRLLEWGPRTSAPVNAMAVDSAGVVYFGGEGTVQGLPLYGATDTAMISAAPGDTTAPYPLEWYALVQDFGAPPSVHALSISGTHLVVGGSFDTAWPYSATGAAAMALYDPQGGHGIRLFLDSWLPELAKTSGTPVVRAVYVDVGAGPSNSDLIYLGGDFDEANQESVNGIALYDDPDNGRGDVDSSFELDDLDAGSVIYGIVKHSSGMLCISGSLTIASTPSIAGVWDGSALEYGVRGRVDQQQDGIGYAIAVTEDHLFIGGDFHEVYNGFFSTWVTYRGVGAILFSSGGTLTWISSPPHPLNPNESGEVVCALYIGGSIWMGGEFTGGSAPNDLRSHALPQ